MRVFQRRALCALAERSVPVRCASLACSMCLIGALGAGLAGFSVPTRAYASAPGPGVEAYFDHGDAAFEAEVDAGAGVADGAAGGVAGASQEAGAAADAAGAAGVAAAEGAAEATELEGDEGLKTQMGVWLLEHDPAAVEAAKQAVRDSSPEEEPAATHVEASSLIDQGSIAVALAMTSSGAGLAALAVGQGRRREREAWTALTIQRGTAR